MIVLSVLIAGGLGAVARFLLDRLLRDKVVLFPTGTFVVNLLGSLLLGVLLGSAESLGDWLPVLGVGFCGGFTTFSTAALDAVELLRARRWWRFVGYWLGMITLSTLAAYLGMNLSG